MRHITKNLLSAAALIAALSFTLTACTSSPADYTAKSYDRSASDIDTITIDVKDRNIELHPSEDDQIHVKYYESEKEYYEIELSDKKELIITGANEKNWKDYIGEKAAKKDRTIELQIPDGAINNLNIKTSNESILLPELSFQGTVSIILNNGNIQLDKLNVGTAAVLETKNGNITGSIKGSYNDFSITSEAKKGENSLPANTEDGSKKISAYTNNGDITLEITQ